MLTKEQMDALPGLLEEATPGPWKVCETSIHGRKYGGCWVEGSDEEDDNGNLHGALIPVSGSHGSKSYTTRLVDRQDHDHNDANARLIALAPSLAATVIEQHAEIERLREACRLLIALDADDDEVIVRRADWQRIRNLVKDQDQ